MHGQIGAAFFEREFQFLHEQALAADLGERAVQNLVTLGGHAQQIRGVAAGFEQGFDVLGLPKRETAFAGCDDEWCGGLR